MPSIVATNLNALTAQRAASRNQDELGVAIARLSSGLRINGARDDAAGLAIADRFSAQVRGTNQAARNANDAISMSQTAESALGSVGEGLQRIRELAVQSANVTNSASDRAALQQEVAQLLQEIDRVATQTQFNGVKLLDGSFSGQAFQVGANAGEAIASAPIASARLTDLGLRGPQQGFTVMAASWGQLPFIHHATTVTIGSKPTVSLGNVEVDDVVKTFNNSGLGFTMTPNVSQVPAGTSSTSASSAGTAIVTINGVDIPVQGVVGGGSLAANRNAVVNAINAQASGIVATNTGSGVSLQAADGRVIVYTYSAGTFTGSQPSDFGLVNSWFGGGTFDINYVAPVGSTGSVVIDYGGIILNYALSPTGQTTSIDVSTVSGAVGALLSVDAALSKVSASRAALGAMQNRFGMAMQTLSNAGESLVAARSRIQDADFAQETARLTSAQLLREAASAMLVQANQQPQQVLALLR